MDRRDVLRAAGLTGLLGLSGCTGAVPLVGETTLGMFAVYNYHQESDHRFDVRIERDGAVVHESSHWLRAFDPTAESASPPTPSSPVRGTTPPVSIPCSSEVMAVSGGSSTSSMVLPRRFDRRSV